MGSYDFPLNHTTSIVTAPSGPHDGVAHIHHEMQETAYFVNLRWPCRKPLSLTRNEPEGSSARTAHRYTLAPVKSPRHESAQNSISFTTQFSLDLKLPAAPSGSATPSPRTKLQRRIIMTQYYMRVNSAGTGQIPQESGLVYNGWWGKIHLEMAVWHCAHWAAWGRQQYFDRVFPAMYETLLPSAAARACNIGWDGARWAKMTELGTSDIAPGETRAYLMWQQPHPMYLAQLAYQAKPTRRTLREWDRVVTATAEYMASFAWYNETSGHYDLEPPPKGVTENSFSRETRNLAFEIAYWRWALDAAADWRSGSWGSAPAAPVDGTHIPWEIWTDANIRGWGRSVLAINPTRIGNTERAIYHLRTTATGPAIWSDPSPPPRFPGGGSVLYAIGYVAVGWAGSEGNAPGFPKDGTWVVKHEGLLKAL
ncbi:hypothetical protein AAE478_003862 [Parahypoxylon ruwenzoriense]